MRGRKGRVEIFEATARYKKRQSRQVGMHYTYCVAMISVKMKDLLKSMRKVVWTLVFYVKKLCECL